MLPAAQNSQTHCLRLLLLLLPTALPPLAPEDTTIMMTTA
jgi:hypothetical protein